MRRVLRHIRPSLLVIVETELWPNLLRTVRESGCRTVMVNARVSDRSFPGYRLGRPFMRRVLRDVTRICTQTATDAERFRQLGAHADSLVVTGNLKFDGRAPEFGKFGARIKEAFLPQKIAHRCLWPAAPCAEKNLWCSRPGKGSTQSIPAGS